jgi:hypothetical protein
MSVPQGMTMSPKPSIPQAVKSVSLVMMWDIDAMQLLDRNLFHLVGHRVFAITGKSGLRRLA